MASIAELSDKKIAISTRRGEVWIGSGLYEKNLSNVTWKKFAQGFHEGFGLFEKDGALWITQRSEITRMIDVDKDGKADQFMTFNDDWGLTTNYHEFSFSTDPDPNGDIWMANCLTGSFTSQAPFRGWILRFNEKGEMIPTSSGVRSPGGIGFNAAGDVFYTDNQGRWNGTSCLKHVVPGKFLGTANGNEWYDHPLAKKHGMGKKVATPKEGSRIHIERERIPELIPPAVHFPHGKIGQSPTGIMPDLTDGKYGPFKNQLFVGEITHSQVQRVMLEKVNGIYQGAVINHLSGLKFGIVPMRMSQSTGYLFLGGTNRGWGSKGSDNFGLARVSYTGKIPFEIENIQLKPKGFTLTFTKPCDPKTLKDPASYKMRAFTYIFQEKYGSPEVDESTPILKNIQVSQDRKKVFLEIEGLVKGHVHEIKLNGIRSADGNKLLHTDLYYTINELVNE